MSVLLEVAVDSLPDALAAEAAGAHRIELCAALGEGGTTPSAGAMRTAVARLGIPVFAMIRPRGGDFLYSATEIEVMLRDVENAKQAGVHGIVSGALHPNGVIDEEATQALVEAADPLPFTFHRAFDQVRNLTEALDTCLGLGVRRVLTSGGAAAAKEGAETIAALVRRGHPHLTIVGGGGVRAEHVAELARATGAVEFHLGPRRTMTSGMRVAGAVHAWREWTALDTEAVRAAVAACGG